MKCWSIFPLTGRPIGARSLKAIAKFFKQTPPDVLVGTVEAIKPAVVSDGKITVDGLRGVEAVLRANGIVKQTVSWDRLVTNDFLPN